VETGGGGSVVLETGGGSTIVEDTGGGVGFSVGSLSVGFGGGSVVEMIPVPGGVVSGIVISDEVGRGNSGIVVSVPFWSGGRTLVIAETTSLRSEVTGPRGCLWVGSAVVVGVGVVDSLTTPVGAITMPVMLVVVVGARETGADESSSDVGGFEIGFTGAFGGLALGCTLIGVSDVRLGSGFVPLPPMILFLPGVGIGAGGTKTVL